MKAVHDDGREFEGDEAEFFRTYQPAGFVKVDADADAKSAADSAEAEPTQSKPAAKKANGE